MQAISLEIGLHLPEYETVVKRTKPITGKKILMWFHSDEEQLKDYFGDRECFWRIGELELWVQFLTRILTCS